MSATSRLSVTTSASKHNGIGWSGGCFGSRFFVAPRASTLYTSDMRKLSTARRATILKMLVEGSSMRSIERVTGASINTIRKLLIEAGDACAAYHDEHVRGVQSKRLQLDDIWQFVYCKAMNVERAKKAPAGAGDTWTWTGIDADSKLVVSWLMGPRDGQSAYEFCVDLRDRVKGRPQITSDALRLYEGALEDAFGADMDYAQLIKIYGETREGAARYSPASCKGTVSRTVQGDPDPDHVSTSYVERNNLTMRMSMRRFTRLTNAFGKKLAHQFYALALYFVFFNFCRIHKSLRMSPAMAAGITTTLRDAEWIVGLLDARAPKPQKPGPKVGSKNRRVRNQSDTLPRIGIASCAVARLFPTVEPDGRLPRSPEADHPRLRRSRFLPATSSPVTSEDEAYGKSNDVVLREAKQS